MAGKSNNDSDVIADINITPFVDVVLVLLIILMVTSVAIVKASLKVELPKAASGGEAITSTLNIVITKEGTLYLDGAPVDEKTIIATVRAEVAKTPGVQAVIAADKGVAYGAVVHVIDLVKTNGVTSFALNIERVPSQDTQGTQEGQPAVDAKAESETNTAPNSSPGEVH